MKEALLYEKKENQKVHCHLCSHYCLIAPGRRGICGVRENQEGVLYSLVYGKLIARHLDPIEKKPLFHFLPGSRSYSIATVGCNFKCLNCQNADISQAPIEANFIDGEKALPDEVLAAALKTNCQSISYTYTEPTIFFEFVYETSALAREKGLKNILVTNGYMSREMLEMYHPYLDAANVDLKSFSDDFYKKICGARLEPVLENLKLMKKYGIWIEVTTLVIPTLNDSAEEFQKIADFISKELGPDVPWHLSAFHPNYKLMNLSPTSLKILTQAFEIGKKAGLKYVYLGNVPGEGETTTCAKCGRGLIKRFGFSVLENNLQEGKCKFCGTPAAGRWS